MQFVFEDCVLDPDRREFTPGIGGDRGRAAGLRPAASIWCRTASVSSARTTCWTRCGRADRLRIDADQPHQRGAQGDRRQRRRAAPDPHHRPQGLPLRRRGQGSRTSDGVAPPQSEPPTGQRAPALALPDKPSIAALPFKNLSGDPEQEYFADGMVEDIITALSRIALALRHRAQLELHLQGPRRRREAGRPRTRRALRARRQRAQGGEPRAHHRAAHRRDDRRHLWADASMARSTTSSICRTRSPRVSSAPSRRSSSGGDRARQAQADREPRRL